ncbi:exported hypothetical protein [Candidatus Sulfotelmatobacter kueseliae]|uniref:DUF4440 domain-containing protein n=1 Tax=Candidatus Sulfotelmatobacter kueseliae TaxID=2042962 RepID=A0A2U3KJ48_9BACT|nr:exported hypothetical protein [Candidatus Sulfotelmatobacter kueseliae]
MKTFIRLIVVACFAGAAFAQQPNQPPKPGPEQQKLQLWAGEWTYEGERQTTFLGPGEKFTGKMTARSISNGFGLESVSNQQSPSGEKQTVEIDTYDPVTKSYPDTNVSSDGSFFQGSFTVSGSLATWEGISVVNGQRYKNRGTSTVASDGMSYIDRGEISVGGKTWVPWFTTRFTKVQDSEKTAVEETVRDFEQAVQDYNLAKVRSLLTPEARWIEDSLPQTIDVLWPAFEQLKSAGVHITYRVHDFETHVQGEVAWVTVSLDSTPSADSAEGQKLLMSLTPDVDCSSQGTHASCNITYVESMVLVKTPGGWKITLGHTSRLPKDQK